MRPIVDKPHPRTAELPVRFFSAPFGRYQESPDVRREILILNMWQEQTKKTKAIKGEETRVASFSIKNLGEIKEDTHT